jgi:FolB domain-containing protein
VDKVIIRDLSVRGIIGIHDWERKVRQEILINLTLFGELSRAGESDRIEDCINYQTIAEKVQAHAETAHTLTVEALAADLARLCLTEPNVQKVLVRVEKPGAIRFARSVGVEIEREKQVAQLSLREDKG